MLIACILVLGACFSPWRSDEGTISIRIGGENDGSAGRKLTNGQEEPLNSLLKNCFFDIYLTNSRNQEQSVGRLNYGDTASFSVVPGRWKITVKAFTKDDKENLVAEGIREVDIIPGPNGDITIPMRRPGSETPPEETIIPIMVTNNSDNPNDEGTLRRAIQKALGSSKKFETIVIDLVNNEITLNNTLPDIANKSVTIRAQSKVTIKRNTSSSPAFPTSFFTIQSSGTLTLGGVDSAEITIDGGNTDTTPIPVYAPLITVDGGTFIMDDGVTLQNNNNFSGNGGGVAVENGIFTMKGGTISGNTAAGFGGGVYVGEQGKFSKTGGTIYGGGGTPPESTDNTATSSNGGHAVYVETRSGNPPRSKKIQNSTAYKNVSLDSETDDNWGL